jgi:hypothetical protein
MFFPVVTKDDQDSKVHADNQKIKKGYIQVANIKNISCWDKKFYLPKNTV